MVTTVEHAHVPCPQESIAGSWSVSGPLSHNEPAYLVLFDWAFVPASLSSLRSVLTLW